MKEVGKNAAEINSVNKGLPVFISIGDSRNQQKDCIDIEINFFSKP